MKSYDAEIPEYVDCTRMAQLMRISRSRLYQLIDQGIVLHPVYLLCTKRPVYTKEMAVRNLQVKEKNVGINGQVIMFYSCRRIDSPVAKPRTSPFEKVREKEITPPKIATKHTQLLEDLEALGIDGVKADEVDAAIRKCFPEGTGDVSGDETLRAVFRYLKRQNSEHKHRT